MGKIARYVSKLDGTMPDVLDQTLDNVFPLGFRVSIGGESIRRFEPIIGGERYGFPVYKKAHSSAVQLYS